MNLPSTGYATEQRKERLLRGPRITDLFLHRSSGVVEEWGSRSKIAEKTPYVYHMMRRRGRELSRCPRLN